MTRRKQPQRARRLAPLKGVKHKDKKEAAEGAALGALTAYLMESGRGQEMNLPKGAKLELELERALYLVKELKRNLNRNGICAFLLREAGLSMPCVAKTKTDEKREQAPALHTEFPIPHLSDNRTNQDLASQNVATSILIGITSG